MSLARVMGAAFLCAGSFAVAEGQQAAEVDLASVVAVVSAAEGHLTGLEALIAAQEAKLDAIYAQRDAASEAGDRDRAAQFGVVIDQLNLTLNALEAERDTIATTVAVLKDQIAVLGGAEQTEAQE
ncbi:hypothetical protein [Yoonia sp.]|uniref:hypothetical protein n=1 Tax=Yoonia sp. TaxID=2212373 RepID=UPI002FDB5D6C